MEPVFCLWYDFFSQNLDDAGMLLLSLILPGQITTACLFGIGIGRNVDGGSGVDNYGLHFGQVGRLNYISFFVVHFYSI